MERIKSSGSWKGGSLKRREKNRSLNYSNNSIKLIPAVSILHSWVHLLIVSLKKKKRERLWHSAGVIKPQSQLYTKECCKCKISFRLVIPAKDCLGRHVSRCISCYWRESDSSSHGFYLLGINLFHLQVQCRGSHQQVARGEDRENELITWAIHRTRSQKAKC